MSIENQTTGTAQSSAGLTDVDLKHHSQELGLLGHVFGSRENAPYYIAALAIVICLVLLGYLFVNQPQNATGMTLLGSIVTGALGYIFGKSSS